MTNPTRRTEFPPDSPAIEQSKEEALPVSRIALRAVLLCLISVAGANVNWAQSLVLDLPDASQRSEISQRIGLTEITIKYHRPLVKERKIWNGVVPYGKVWRAGANENTTIRFSDPVQIEGKPIDAGTYGLHILPNADEWTIIFSRNSTSWGSFTYSQAEDALRVAVKPAPVEMHNALTFEFDEMQPDSSVVQLAWEKIAVRFKVVVDVHAAVQASLKKQLRSLAQISWMSWDDAANYLLKEKLDPATALTYANKSIENEDRFDNEITKSRILTALNRKEEAAAAEKKALALANALQMHSYARQLLNEKRKDEAFAIFNENALKHPNDWFVYTGLARVYSAQGKFEDAAMEMKIALTGAPESQRVYLDGLVKQLEAKQDINQ
jgi:tetratricopeptide (TPR) repeat protein